MLESLFNEAASLKAWNFIKRDSSTGIFPWILKGFSKNIIYRTLVYRWLLLLIPPFQPKFYPLITLFFFFYFIFFLLYLNNCNHGSFFRKGVKMKIFYFLQKFIWKLTWMLLRQFCLGNNLLMHIRENTDFPWQKPWQLSRAEVNFKGCILY